MNASTRMMIATFIGIVLTGCSLGGKQGAQQQYNDSSKPLGYYSNEKSTDHGSALNDNHGVIMRMVNNKIQKPAGNSIQKKILPLKNETQTEKNQEFNPTKYSTNEVNTNAKNEAKIKKAALAVKNVKSAQAATLGMSVVISVTLRNEALAEKTKAQIKESVKPYLGGRPCTIITNNGMVNRKMNRHNDLLENGAR